MKIAQVGDYSVSNWGDQLYPGASRHLFARLGLDVTPRYFAPLAGATSTGEMIRPYTEVGSSDAEAVLVGGGDLIRFDSGRVALDHLSVPHEQRHRRLTRLRARRYARRHLVGGPGAWMPSRPWVDGAPTALVSVGVHPVPAGLEIERAFSHVRAAWARTKSGYEKLRGAGMSDGRVLLAPDMVFGLAEFEHPDPVRDRGMEIVADKLGRSDPPALFHAATFHGWPQPRVEAALASLRGMPVAVLSLGAYSGEDRTLAAAARAVGAGEFIGLDTDDITAVLAAAGAIFTTSMHAAIVAGSFGTPVLVPGIQKTSEAFATCPVPPQVDAVEESHLADVMRSRLGTRHHHDPGPNAAAATEALRGVMERLAAS